MTILLKVLAAAVAGSILSLVVKKNNPDISLALTVALSALIMYLCADILDAVLAFLRVVADGAGIPNATLSVVLKTAGLSVLTRLAADTCRDAGQSSAAAGIEFMGAVVSVYIALPLFQTVLDMLRGLV